MSRAQSLKDLMRNRAHKRAFLGSINANLGTALGFKKPTDGELTDELAISVFVPVKINAGTSSPHYAEIAVPLEQPARLHKGSQGDRQNQGSGGQDGLELTGCEGCLSVATLNCRDGSMRVAPILLSSLVLLLPTALHAQVIVPLDLTAGYVFNAPGELVPFRGAVTVSFDYRVSGRVTIGVPVGYVRADSTDAGTIGGQVGFRLLGDFDDLNLALLGRATAAPVGTRMVPITVGVVGTFFGARTGVFITRDVKREATALELLVGLDLVAVGDLYDALTGGS